MANQEQLDILKQGVDVWNKWRKDNPTIKIDLSNANLKDGDFSRVAFWGANLNQADLSGSNLSEANLYESTLGLSNLMAANLNEAHFKSANFFLTNCEFANFSKTELWGVKFSQVNLAQTDFKDAYLGQSIFVDTDLSQPLNLHTITHFESSTIGEETILRSKGKIDESFLRGCGLADWQIESSKLANPDLSNEEIVKIQYRVYDLRATQSIQISPLFISYSHADNTFVDELEKSLNEKGVRFWRDIHDMTAGRMETQIDRAIRQNPTVLLILSKNSMNSDWVQHEVRKARDLEKELGRDALCPIALDDGWKSSRWPQRVMEQVMEYNILDFSKWEDESTFKAKFAKLLSGLDLFYKKPEA